MMEVSRYVTIGRYVPGDSVLHRLDPRTKLLTFGLLVSTLLVVKGYVPYLLLLGFAVVLLLLSRIPVRYVLAGLRPALWVLAILWVFQIIFSGSSYPDHPTLFRLGSWRATWGGVHAGALNVLRISVLYLLTSLLTLTAGLVELADAGEMLLSPLARLGVPLNEVALVFTIALRFVPTLAEELERLVKAQISRGARLDEGGFLGRARRLIPLVVPLFLSIFDRAEDLILAMEARCYRGGRGRSKAVAFAFQPLDALAAVVVLAVVAAAWLTGLMLPF